MIATGPDQPFSGIIRLTAGGLAWAWSKPVITGTAYPGATLTSSSAAPWAINGAALPGESGLTFLVPWTVSAGDLITAGTSDPVSVPSFTLNPVTLGGLNVTLGGAVVTNGYTP